MSGSDLVVIKFGGTALGTAARVRRAALRIRRLRRSGRPVVAVVSAAGHETDRLLARVCAVAGRGTPATSPATSPASSPALPPARCRAEDAWGRERDRTLATGEEQSAALLAGALLAAGVPARSLRGGEAGLRADGSYGAGTLARLRPGPLRGLLAEGVVPVVAGFQASSRSGETITLGRGASDLSAVFLAGALGAAECHIVTDVAGVYDLDPRSHKDARRYERLRHHELVTLTENGAGVVHSQAARLAARWRLPLVIYDYRASPASPCGTTVCSIPTDGTTARATIARAATASDVARREPPAHSTVARVQLRERTVRIALAGCGVVGGALARTLIERRSSIEAAHGVRLELVRVLVRREAVARPFAEPVLTTALDSFLETPADIVVEALGGTDPALRIARAALSRGSRLVTANKTLVANAGHELAVLAAAAGATFDFEAAVGGGIPVVRALRDALAHAPIRRVQGIVNGTCNFVLTEMERGQSLAAAVARAQQLGYAEADPTRDLDGTDAAEKLAILAWLAFGVPPHQVHVRRRGIGEDAVTLLTTAGCAGGRLRLLAECRRTPDGVVASVAPAVVPADSGFGRTLGVENRISLDLGWDGEIALAGPGAGAEPTAAALLGDVLRACAPLRTGATALTEVTGSPPPRVRVPVVTRLALPGVEA